MSTAAMPSPIVPSLLLAALVSAPALTRFAAGQADATETAVRFLVAAAVAWAGIRCVALLISATSPKPAAPDPAQTSSDPSPEASPGAR